MSRKVDYEFVEINGEKINIYNDILHLSNKEIKDIDEIKNLEKLSNLKELYLNGNQISEIKGLEKLTKLDLLDLTENHIIEINGLDSLVNLKILKLGKNNISEITGLDYLISLENLELNKNQITEIKSLKTLIKLEILSISDNQITEIKGLEHLKNMSFEDLIYGPSENYDIEMEEREIRYSTIQFNIVESLRRIIMRISEAHHGSTLILGFKGKVLDKKLFHPGGIKIYIPYGTTFLRLKSNPEDNQEIINLISTYEKAIISLSKTDGAIVFDSNLDLISVGTFLKTNESGSVIGGARRKFAEGFVKDNPDTIAFVISQDGTITFFSERMDDPPLWPWDV